MLYVDGMNGVIEDSPTIQWLYTLLTSRFRLVVKTALKLLLVFIEYVESNCLIFIQAVLAVHQSNGTRIVLLYSNLRYFSDEVCFRLLSYCRSADVRNKSRARLLRQSRMTVLFNLCTSRLYG